MEGLTVAQTVLVSCVLCVAAVIQGVAGFAFMVVTAGLILIVGILPLRRRKYPKC